MTRASASKSGLPRVRHIVRKTLNSGRVFASWINLRLTAIASNKRYAVGGGGATSNIADGNTPHLLLIAWSFPPEINGGVYRPTALAKYAVRVGWKVTVTAGSLKGQQTAAGIELLNSLPTTVGISRALSAPPTSYKLLPKVDGGFSNIVPIAQAAIAACQDSPPTIVLASGPPFLTFISANFVAKHFRVPLVLEYRDEWSVHTPQFVSVSAFDKKWERKLLRSAAAVVFVTEAARAVYLASINVLDASKCLVVPSGWDPDDFSEEAMASADNSAQNHGKLVISFLGTTGRMADPSTFLARFQEVLSRCPILRERLLVRFTGPKSDELRGAFVTFRNQFPDSIELIEVIPKSAAVAEMRQAGALLLLVDSCSDTAIPGKLYEYLAAGPPILVFGEAGPAAGIVASLGAGLIVPTDNSFALEAVLCRLLQEPRAHWDTPGRKAWAAAHTRSAQAAQMLKILTQRQ